MTQQVSGSHEGKLSLNPSSNLVKQVIDKPLTIITNPSGDYAVAAGETFELRVTISNQGNQGAIIDIFIDETSGLLQRWCTSPHERLALGSGHSGEVIFQFQVPSQAIPDTYSYLLIIDAPVHYPEDTPIRHEARLQVLPPVQLAVRVNDPTFTTLPATSSTKPAVIQPGKSLPFRVLVNNRSDRVDRFRLTCTDMPEDWFTVLYPEGISALGLVIEADSLALNPGAKGEILLQFNFPLDMTAGSYSPTLRLTSINNLDLVLMDVMYLQVLPIHNLKVELQTLVGNVKRQAGQFQVIVTNAGNTVREIVFRARGDSEEHLCTYTLKPVRLSLRPKEIARTDLYVQPTKWWRRPWFGKGLRIKYYLDLEDTYQLPLSKKTFEGRLVWEARPWWQLVGVLLIGVGIIAALVFLIWWLFFRPLTPPKIVEFSSEAPSYQEANRDFIYLRWQIRHPEQLRMLRIVEQSPNDSTNNNSQPVSYDFSQGIPSQLKQFCTLNDVLICRDVRTDARQKGSYVFEMEVFSKQGKDTASDSRKTNIIKIESLAPPKIVEFEPTAPIYQEASHQSVSPDNNNIRLNWKIINPYQMQELRLIGRASDGSVNSRLMSYDFSKGIPEPLKQFCLLQATLICRNVSTDARKAGDYIFELSVVPRQNDSEAIASKKTDTIKIQAKQTPFKIVSFQINGQEAPPKYLVPINPNTPVKSSFLSWKIEGDKDLKVELLPAPGTVPLEGKIPLAFRQQPGNETFTLQVTNASGQQIKRSVAIETFIPTPRKPLKKDAKASSLSPTGANLPSPTGGNSPSPTGANLPSPTGGNSPLPTGANLPSPTSTTSPSPIVPEPPSPAEAPPRFN